MTRSCARLSVNSLLCAVAVGNVSCGDRDPTASERLDSVTLSIVGGSVVPVDAWQNVVWLDVGCSAVALHERLVVFAGHCGADVDRVWTGNTLEIVERDSANGTPSFVPQNGDAAVHVARCGILSAEYATGADLAYCVLSSPLHQIAAIPAAAGCELHDVDGHPATLVGYGTADEQGSGLGQKRQATDTVSLDDSEYRIGSRSSGTCDGDSGGPAFIRVGSPPEWRVLGILSSGDPESCGVGWYTPLSRHLAWLEQETQLELSPCFDDGEWAPLPSCVNTGVDESGRSVVRDWEAATTCGAAVDVPPDEQPPSIEIVELEQYSQGTEARLHAAVVAGDGRGQGVRAVTAAILESDNELPLLDAVDELEPFDFDFPLNGGTTVRSTACDYAGNCRTVDAVLETPASIAACSFGLPHSGKRQRHGGAICIGTCCALLVLRRKSRQSPRPCVHTRWASDRGRGVGWASRFARRC